MIEIIFDQKRCGYRIDKSYRNLNMQSTFRLCGVFLTIIIKYLKSFIWKIHYSLQVFMASHHM